GHPVLSDFGIASTLSESNSQEAVGMSIPWSAPEVLMDETPGSVQSEVWALAATVYSLLAGRSPFENPAGSNTSADLISRITRGKPQPIGRDDVPASLERLLLAGMSRKPENRPASILELITALQAIETELGVQQTAIDVAMDDWALATVSDLEERTRVRPVAGVPVGGARRRRRAPAPGAAGTIWRDNDAGGTEQKPAPTGRRMHTLAWVLVATAVLVIALGATATVVLVRAAGGIPTVSDIAGTANAGTVQFSWDDPGLRDSDSYLIVTADGDSSIQRSTGFLVDAEPGERVCITVTVNREGKSGPASAQKCVDVAG
ncbi:MAG: serine/threonine protein kinase, partial [Glaciihabitans sp.]|nr:serine/threonine protein kinase [Glaciihabitans sp.]